VKTPNRQSPPVAVEADRRSQISWECTEPPTHGSRWYDPTISRWLEPDPSGLGPDADPYRYAGNDPTNETDPSGLEPSTKSVVNDRNRDQYIAKAKTELDAAVASKKITQGEAGIRLEVVKAVLAGQIVDEDTEKQGARDPNLWDTNPKTGEWQFKLDVGAAASAIDAAYSAKPDGRIGFWCKKASQFHILRGQLKAADKLGRVNFDVVAGGSTPTSLFPEDDQDPNSNGKHNGKFTQVERNFDVGIDPKTLLPGDQTWVRNPQGSGTEAGSNKIYIGGGESADPYAGEGGVLIQNYSGYLDFVHDELGHPDRSSLKINRVARPIVPSP
jgi:hypothetical protein